jgi:hypothetical protein
MRRRHIQPNQISFLLDTWGIKEYNSNDIKGKYMSLELNDCIVLRGYIYIYININIYICYKINII